MNPTQKLKRQHEKAVAKCLVETLNISDMSFDRMGDDINEPDVIYKTDDVRIGIEIVSGIY